MSATILSSDTLRPADSQPDLLAAVREYWNGHIHDWKVARAPAGTRDFFEEIEAYRYEKLAYLPRLVNFAVYAGKRVLDVGCGVGNDLSRFARHGAEVVGVDLAPRSIEFARTNFRQRGLAGELDVMNGEQLGFSDDSFDVVFCHTVLHFTPEPRRMVQEIHRVLRPGGEAILMTVNRRSWLNLLQWVMQVEIDHLDAPVFRQFTAAEFRDLLAPFPNVQIVAERFPVPTKVHGGLKGRLYNALFVDLFNALPRGWVQWSGHHLMAFATKTAPPGPA
jgi:2-polyprenyl-3-methyl-5-hydroxy-6-metoxy-1,4-benzoquinol methylase